MKTRIISAAVLVPLLFLVALAADKVIAAVVLGLILALAAYELLYRTGLVKHPRLVVYSCVMAFAMSMWSFYEAIPAYLTLLLAVFFLLLFAEMLMNHIKVRFEMLGLCFLAGFVIPYMLSSLIRILTLSIGRYVILIPFVAAFINDGGAYFVGIKFGRHKLAPVVSPNKTVEGLLGGVAASVVCMLLYAVIVDLFPGVKVNYLLAMLYGLVGSLAGTLGDLCFSVIKRQTGIKDYGDLIPGHGGALDRFDSLTVVAPVMEVLILLLPMVS